ncbi:YolD-like family protein [Peribacillus simplex]|uniref:YolD-like protein n=1 Tax=Peribacillus simplex TaxID=1478 RepID=A0AAN2TRC0_9BACI|nr:YolD-like family protein [Peribacillus simplex]CEG31062.1 YolD-like protein [Peribacillus simplex]
MPIRDRGNIKWTSLMLPEHIKMLRQYFGEEYYDEPEPVLDEQHLEEMNDLIAAPMEFTFPISFTLYQNNRQSSLEGLVHYVDQMNRHLRVIDVERRMHKIPFSTIKGVKKI